jgi:hypothetical protein
MILPDIFGQRLALSSEWLGEVNSDLHSTTPFYSGRCEGPAAIPVESDGRGYCWPIAGA